MTIEQIARVCHEANRVYCASIKDHSHMQWSATPEWARNSVTSGVQFALDHPDVTPEQSHQSWLAMKQAEGWKPGPVKSVALKEHPCCVRYEDLPPEHQVKDVLFLGIVSLFRGMVTD